MAINPQLMQPYSFITGTGFWLSVGIALGYAIFKRNPLEQNYMAEHSQEGNKTAARRRPRKLLNADERQLWHKRKAEPSEELEASFHQVKASCEPDCEAHYWQVAWKREKDRADEHEERLNGHAAEAKSASKGEIQGKPEEDVQLAKELEQVRQNLEDMQVQCGDQKNVIKSLRIQVAEHKRHIAFSLRDEDGGGITDDQVISDFDNIFNRTRNVAARLCRGSNFRFKSLSNETQAHVSKFIPPGQSLPDNYAIDIVTSLISICFLNLASPANYFGISEYQPVKSAIDLTRHFAANQGYNTRKWMEDTRKLLVAMDANEVNQAQSAVVDEILGNLRDAVLPAVDWKTSTENDVRKILKSAFELFQRLLPQRDVYQVQMLLAYRNGQRFPYDSTLMDITHVSPAGSSGDTIEVSVFPGLYKTLESGEQHIIYLPKVIVRKESQTGQRLEESQEDTKSTDGDFEWPWDQMNL